MKGSALPGRTLHTDVAMHEFQEPPGGLQADLEGGTPHGAGDAEHLDPRVVEGVEQFHAAVGVGGGPVCAHGQHARGLEGAGRNRSDRRLLEGRFGDPALRHVETIAREVYGAAGLSPVRLVRVPLAIGLALTLIHLISIPVTNTSVNPARSLATAIFAQSWALEQVWAFFVFPIIGGLVAAFIWLRVSPVRAVIAIGTFCRFSVRRWAVTTTSSSPPPDAAFTRRRILDIVVRYGPLMGILE